MDSIGNYIYLIIIVSVGVISLLKKKPDTNANDEVPTPPSTDWEEILREIIEPKTEEVDIPAANIEEPVEVEKVVSFENTNNTNVLRAKKQVSNLITNQPIHTSSIEIIEEEMDTDLYQIQSINDAKKAFIYSEIFSKKY